MKTIDFTSKTYGRYTVMLDDVDFERVNASGKWCVCIKRGNPYFQKRVDCAKGSKGRIIEMHRWLMGEPRGMYIDHINNDTLDNRRSNLRICSNGANIRNGKLRVNNKSGVKGVFWDKRRNKWEAYIKVNYRRISLGRFSSKEDAINARKKAEVDYWDM